ncbi:MAG TPA: hypothetical protein VG604_01625 [Candidatus Saccharimonadales bacterium]|nr:hypothetical protein [Candidatus Saccharimonadales bacterium]
MKRLLRSLVWSLLAVSLSLTSVGVAHAANNFPDESASGSIGIKGTISSAPPKQGPTITTPGNGASFTEVPITVSGLCPPNTIVKIFSNNIFVGSTFCQGGSYSLQIDLFSGKNDLVARAYDALDQSGPDSNTVSVTFNDAQFLQHGTHVHLSSVYAEKGAPPGQELDWPVVVSGGQGPYAISINWGDGTANDLFSIDSAGTFIMKHVYKQAGIYKIVVQATDKNGGTAYLQLIGQATGATQNNSSKESSGALVKVEVLWWPALAMLPLIFASFWVGRRYELYVLRKQLEKQRQEQA